LFEWRQAKQKLDLIQFASGEMAETDAGATQVVRGKPASLGASCGGANHIP
jgi:hypothetical protein